MKRPASTMRDASASYSAGRASVGMNSTWAFCAKNGWNLIVILHEWRKKIMNTKYSIDETILDPSLKLRPVQWSDLEAVAQLIYDACAADGDTIVAVTPEELRHEWETPEFNLERDAFLVETSDGRIVGYESFEDSHEHALLHTDGYVHPDFKGRGIGTS